MDDNPIPPLVDLARKLDGSARWVRLCQQNIDRDEPNPNCGSQCLAELTALEAAIVRAREVLGG